MRLSRKPKPKNLIISIFVERTNANEIYWICVHFVCWPCHEESVDIPTKNTTDIHKHTQRPPIDSTHNSNRMESIDHFFSPSVHFVFTFYIWAHSICLELCWILIEMWKGNTLKQFNYVVKMCKCDTAEVVECLDGFLLAISLPNTRFAVLNYNLQRMKNRHSIWIHGNLSIPFSTL